MANTQPAVVTQVTGRAWIRNSDGSLTELHVGSRVPADSDVVTATGATVALQVNDGLPLVIGENRDVSFNADMAGHPVDAKEASVAPPQGTDSDRLLAALNSGQDPFDNLEPTAALISGGGDGGGSSFVRLARIVESTSPLDLVNGVAAAPAVNVGVADAAASTAALNVDPIAGNDVQTTTEKATVSGNILTNDTDANGDALAIVSVGTATMVTGGVTVAGSNGGTFTVFPDGSYVFNPGDAFHQLAAGQSATSSMSYTVTDPFGATSTATLTVTVNGLNDAPTSTAVQAQNMVDAQHDVKVDVSGNFHDVDNGDKLTFSATGLPPGLAIDPTTGVISGNIDHSASQGGDHGVYTVVVTATDLSGATSSQTFSWDVTNPAPTAVNDAGSATQDSGIEVSAANGVLRNDSDPDGDTLSVGAVNGNAALVGNAVAGDHGGSFTLNADGSYSFTPGEDFKYLVNGETATTSITYTVSDGEGGTSTATLTVTVSGADDAAIITPHGEGDAQGLVTEDATLTASGKLDVSDLDAGQAAFVAQARTDGDHGTFAIDANGNWTYALNNGDPKVQALAEGESLTETFTVASLDGTTSTVTVTIDGTNDLPVIGGEHTGAVQEDATQTATGQLTVTDVDTSDTHTFSAVGDTKGTYGTFSVDADGKWTYTLDNKAAQALTAADSIEETYTVQVADNHGGTSLQTVTVTIQGTDDAAIITPHGLFGGVGATLEDLIKTASGKLDIVDPDAGQAHFQVQTNTAGTYGTFSIEADGKWTYALNNSSAAVQGLGLGETRIETFTVTSADGTTAEVRVSVTGTNDAPVISGQSAGAAQEDLALSTTGKLVATDADLHDTATWSVIGSKTGTYGTFSLDPKTGEWTYNLNNDSTKVQALAEGQTVTEKFTVLVSDGHLGFDTQVVTITIQGNNDNPVIHGAATGAVVEDTALSATGHLTVTDVDKLDTTHTWSIASGTSSASKYGSFSVDANGTWTYNLNNAAAQSLGAGKTVTEYYYVTVADTHGGTDTQKVEITITGTNDAAVITPHFPGDDKGTVYEDGGLFSLTAGNLDVTDKDTGEGAFQAQKAVATPYGTFSIDADGHWLYALNNANATVQALGAGEKMTDVITVKSLDGTESQVTVTIVGTNDAPVISGVATGTVQEDLARSTTGKLVSTDVDAHDTATWSVIGSKTGTYGTFSLDPKTGEWTYNLNNDSTKVQALAEGQTVTEKFTVLVSDGHLGFDTQVVTITIQGNNDNPVIHGAATGAVVEDTALSATGHLTVTDVDKLDTTHTWSIASGTSSASKYGSFSVDANGTWTYNLNNAAAQSLGAGKTVTEYYYVTVADTHGGTDTQKVEITITGTNDAAVITPHFPGDDKGTVYEDGGLFSLTAGNLDVTDKDTGEGAFQAQKAVATPYGTFSIDADGHWLYALNNANATVQALGAGEKMTDVITVKSLDGTESQVTVTIVGTNDAPVISGVATGTVVEDGVKTVSGQLSYTDVDAHDSHGWSVVGSSKGAYGSISVDASGEWTYNLNNAAAQSLGATKTVTETYYISVGDNHGGYDVEKVTITIQGTNDNPVIAGTVTGKVVEDGIQKATGQLSGSDVDVGDRLTWSLASSDKGAYGTLVLGANGKWTYTLDNDAAQSLGKDVKATDTFIVTLSDNHGGSTTQEVTVTIVGANDNPKITGTTTGSVTEDADIQTAQGQLTGKDVDVGDHLTWTLLSDAKGDYGSLTLDGDGKWVYTLDNNAAQSLGENVQATDKFTIQLSDDHGGKTTQVVTVTIAGTNDDPTITGTATGTVNEDAVVQTSQGQLYGHDVDAGDTLAWSLAAGTNGQGQYGTFSVDSNGKWTYELDNAKAQSLSGADHVDETFTVQVSDGHGGVALQEVTVTVQGVNDAPVSADGVGHYQVEGPREFSLDDFAFQDGAGEHDHLQSVIITGLPQSGTLELNGVAVTAGQSIAASEIDAGHLVYVPAAGGGDTSFSFQVQDDGGRANGGQDTSGTYTFSLVNDHLVVGDNTGGTVGIGGAGNNIILGDTGGTVTTTTPGQSYNIALVVDESKSMDNMQLAIAALTQFVKQLANHDGTINLTLIGFGTTGSNLFTIDGLKLTDVDQGTDALMKAISNLSASSNSSNYEAAFDTATAWFNGEAAKGYTTANGYQNLTFFLSDGAPNTYNNTSGSGTTTGNTQTTDTTTMLHSVDSFADLSAISTVHAIGLGNDVNQAILKYFDNTDVTGTGVIVGASSSATNLSTSTTYNLDAASGWTLVQSGGNVNGGNITGSTSAHSIKISDSSSNKASTIYVSKTDFVVADGDHATFSFNLKAAGYNSGDTVTWVLGHYVGTTWVADQTGVITDSGNYAITTNSMGAGDYHLRLEVDDNSSQGGNTLSATVSDITMNYGHGAITAPYGEVDIVQHSGDLTADLHEGSSTTTPNAVGGDTINGGDGNDIIFGDGINTDALNSANHAAGTHNGAGLQGLVDYLNDTLGHATDTDIYSYIKDHSADLVVGGDTRGGDDVIHGGNGDDIIYGGGGDDTLFGDAGNDILVGGAGNDTLYGGAGSDTFKWMLNDQGTTSHPAVDTVKDFSTAAAKDGGDILDLAGLLHNAADGALTDYLHFTKDSSGSTVIEVSTTGKAATSTPAIDQKIVLEGVDLTNGGALKNDQEIINDLLTKGKLHAHD